MDYNTIIVKEKDLIGRITFNKPPLNIINIEMMKEINKAIKDFQKRNLKVLIINANGKAFSAGVDVSDHTKEKVNDMIMVFHEIFTNLNKINAPTVALVNGAALGGGCEVLMNCDITIAGRNAKIGQPEINLGISPGFCGTQCLPRLVGRAKAKELLLTGRNLDAEEAYQIGLVNMVVDNDKLEEKTEKLAKKIASKSPVQTAFIKALVNMGTDIDMHSACALEVSYFSSSFSTKDQKEGMNAFVEKKRPTFKGK